MTTQNKRQAFTFYRSFYESLKGLPPRTRLELYDAIFSVSFEEVSPEYFRKIPGKLSNFKSNISQHFWELLEPNLSTSLKNWKNGCQPKRSDAASKIEATPSLKIKNKIIDKEKEEKNIYSPEFEKLWNASKRGSKANAWREYQAHAKGVDPALIERALKQYITDNPDPKYQKHLERWLKSKMWETYQESAPPKPKLTINPPPDDFIEIHRS